MDPQLGEAHGDRGDHRDDRACRAGPRRPVAAAHAPSIPIDSTEARGSQDANAPQHHRATAQGRGLDGRLARPAHRALRELLLIAVLFTAYKTGRLAATGRESLASDNARRLWDLERLLHLPSEATVQQALVGHGALIGAANSYYAYVHFPATAACLLWLYLRHPAQYRRTRSILAWLTAAGLALHLLFPLAPPRLAAVTGLIDTGTRYGPSVYGPPSTDTLSNQFAAMPSLHVGWAIVVAAALIAATPSPLGRLWAAHPVITTVVVVGTGNHYWLDAGAAVTLILVTVAVQRGLGRVAWRPLPRACTW
ncbi:phosphatase PAP2 family protein [Catellatospora sp. KI3]|uniref:phosphatase PAP2 family protein n=1 Tax=Catellatospora sp. KI3 TaxID=3041620 RepID=UPI0024823A97|nr:phosphatase PAP2 family protein [Catellatospora sp. KI3]MDI1460855.1 phosphatase PAP2 family protein [Catellatospora sp. KI3]